MAAEVEVVIGRKAVGIVDSASRLNRVELVAWLSDPEVAMCHGCRAATLYIDCAADDTCVELV